MNKEQKITLIILAAFVVFIIALGLVRQKSGTPIFKSPLSELNKKGTTTEEIAEKPVYVSEVPKNAVLTEPTASAPASLDSENKLRIFNLEISKKGYSPDEIVVNKGDTVRLNFTSVDADYDWSMPYTGHYQFIKKGETKLAVFEVRLEGVFLFECRDYCPASGKIQGKLIVRP